MKYPFAAFALLTLTTTLSAQNVYTIKADSTKLTGCDSNELIIENHTQAVPGFLFNTGNGRTIFKRPLTKISDTAYLVGADTLKIRYPTAWVQGGNSFGTTGVLGTKDNNHLDLYTNNTRRARLDSLGNLLIGVTTSGPYKLDAGGNARVNGYLDVTQGDPYAIRLNSVYQNGWATGIDASMISFGGPCIGVNKQTLGNIPTSSILVGRASPGNVTAVIDYYSNPVFVVNGNGAATINGGYNGIGTGGSVGNTNVNSFDFAINGGRGTGTGTPGDIIFSTGTAQASGTTIHTMTNRWWMKGGTGYLSNTAAPRTALETNGWIMATTGGLSVGATSFSNGVPGNGIPNIYNNGVLATYSAGSGQGYGHDFLTNGFSRLRIVDTATIFGSGNVFGNTSGNVMPVNFVATFAPITGNASFSAVSIANAISQQVGGTGITRGLYIHPSLTATVDFRAIEVTVGKSIFNDKVSVGTSASPTAKLLLGAGSATAGTAPLKLTSGTVLSSPEDGAIEYDGTDYYITQGAARFKLSKTLTGQTTTNFGAPSVAPGNTATAVLSVPGVAAGDVVTVNANAGGANPPSIMITAYSTATDTVTIRAYNAGSSTVTLASDTYKVRVIK